MVPFMAKLFVVSLAIVGLHCQSNKEQQDLEALLYRLQGSHQNGGSSGGSTGRFNNLGNSLRNLDSLGGGHLLRQTRGIDSLSGISLGGQKRFDSMSGMTFGGHKRSFDVGENNEHQRNLGKYLFQLPIVDNNDKYIDAIDKKNFDEIDRSGFDSFVKKNFDEIDRAGFRTFVKKNEYLPFALSRYYSDNADRYV